MVIFLFACDKDENGTQRKLKLQSVGFTGTLPDGWKFGTTGIIAQNGLGGAASSDDGSYIRHGLSIADTVVGFAITLELPQIKYSNDFITRNDLKPVARQYYSYNTVKEKLSVGNKLLLSRQNQDVTKCFRLQMWDEINYIGFTADYDSDTASYLKVTDLIEGTEPDPVLGQVKILEVIFDLSVQVHQVYPIKSSIGAPVKVKGLLRMKYREI